MPGIRDLTPAETKEQKETLPALDEILQNAMNMFNVLPITQFHVQKTAYGSNTQLFVEQFNDVSDLCTKAPKRYKFDTINKAVAHHGGHNDEEQEDEELVKVKCVWKTCKQHMDNHVHVIATAAGDDDRTSSMGTHDRNNLEAIYKKKNENIAAPLKETGSPGYMTKEWTHACNARVYPCSSDETLGYLETFQKKKIRKPDGAGHLYETQEEVPFAATDWTHLQARWLVRQTTKLMCIYSLTNVKKIQTTKTRFVQFYKFLTGPNIAERPVNKPTTEQLRNVENKAWEHMANQLTTGEDEDVTTLDDAMKQILVNANFWHNNLYVYCDSPTAAYQAASPDRKDRFGNKGAGKPWTPPPVGAPWKQQPQWGAKQQPSWNTWTKAGAKNQGTGNWYNAPGKGKGNPKGKQQLQWNPTGKGPDASKTAWAGRLETTDPTANYPSGQQVCRLHHLRTACPGKCSRSHNICPNKKADGTWCKGPHPAFRCPTGHNPGH